MQLGIYDYGSMMRFSTSAQPLSSQNSPSASLSTSYFISLRIKLLVGFTLVFSLVFVGVFYWFYQFTTDEMMARLRADMRTTLEGAAKGIDVAELLDLYTNGQPNAAGFSDDPRFKRQLDWFDAIHQTEPRAWFYTFIVGKFEQNRRIGPSKVPPGEDEIIYLVDLWARYDPSKASRFLESDILSLRAQQVIESKALAEHPNIYTDKWGTWLSAAAPLVDTEGQVVAVLGLDIEADYIFQVQQKTRNRLLIGFAIAYLLLLFLVYALSSSLTYQIVTLKKLTRHISKGQYDQALRPLESTYFPDEMHHLYAVFLDMVNQVHVREKQIVKGRQAEYEVRLALQHEKELNTLKSRFISMISHEFRTPLTIIKTSTEMLERYGQRASNSKRQIYFQRIKETIQKMLYLLEDVLMTGQADTGKLQLNLEAIELNQLCQEVIQEVSDVYGQGHRIIFNSPQNFLQANFDSKLLRSMLVNLVSNAVKYSSPGSLVTLDLIALERMVQFQIRDQGIGIPLDDQAHLFEAFHRARNVSNIRGTGLGLQIVKQIVDLHQGSVTFSSQEGKGTTFTVQLPTQIM